MYETWLRSFHAVARHGGFTAAADSLNLSQPTITEQVKALEEKFSVELFHRRGRVVRLTDQGRSLYDITTGVAGHTEEAVRFLRGAADMPGGRFAIGSVTPYHIMPAVKAFQDRYPGLDTALNVDHRRGVIQGLFDFRLDVALIGRFEDDPRILNKHLGTHEVQVLLPIDHRLAGKEALRIHDLAEERIVLREDRSTTRRALEDAANAVGIEFPVAMQVDSREAIREAVLMGIGFGLVTERETIPTNRLCTKSIADADLNVEFHVACLKSRAKRPLIRSFMDIATVLGE